jgi:hypothetical protein
MNQSDLPNPPLVGNPARRDVRRRWIGKRVRYQARHLRPPHPFHPDRDRVLKDQELWRRRGVGTILDVGRAGWFLIRWQNGDEQQDNKIDVERVD